MRLFAALWPSPEAVAALEQELAAAGSDWPPDGWRAIPPSRWHLTLCFYGDDADPGVCARQLEAGVSGLAAPRLRMAGSGFFPRLAYAAVVAAGAADDAALAELVAGASGQLVTGAGPGADGVGGAAGQVVAGPDVGPPDGYLPHITVARSRRGRAWPPADSPLHRHRGPWWRPMEARLVHSSLVPAPPRFRMVHRVPLAGH